MHGGGRYERVQDQDRAESTATNVATGGGGRGDCIVRRVVFGAGAGANQDRLWRIAHRRARLFGQGPSDVQADPLRGKLPRNGGENGLFEASASHRNGREAAGKPLEGRWCDGGRGSLEIGTDAMTQLSLTRLTVITALAAAARVVVTSEATARIVMADYDVPSQ